jgi:succinylglutamate desuccinylase
MADAKKDYELPAGREIGRIRSERPGPTLIAIAGVHGNERAGVPATRRVLAMLERRSGAARGELLAICGNLGAMRDGVRFRHRDMNRAWTEARVADVEKRAKTDPSSLDVEDQEQLEILSAIRDAIARARGPVYIVDLHTTSAPGLPFMLFGDTLNQRRFASAIPLPIVLGLQEQVDGTLCSYWTTHGCIGLGIEGGQNDDPASIDNLEAVLLLAAESAGIFGTGLLTETGAAHALLERRRGSLPHVMEVVSRHPITAEDRFKMEPGFLNLARVRQDQLLARDRAGEIRAQKDGYILLPLYQGLGAEGFFWGREVSATRLRVSEVLRQMKLDRFLHLLPGITRDATHPSRFIVGSRAERLYPRDVFHTFGYRRERKNTSGDRLTMERQAEPS